jgi:hypothetical protein
VESKEVETYIGSGRRGFSKTVDPMRKNVPSFTMTFTDITLSINFIALPDY